MPRSTSKPAIFHLGPVRPTLFGALSEHFDVTALDSGATALLTDARTDRASVADPLRPDFVAPEDVLANVRAIVTATTTIPISGRFLAHFPAVELVASFGVGHDHIDLAVADARGISVTNTPNVLDEEVADLTIGLLLSTLRELPQAAHYLREGRWEQAPYPLSRGTLRGRTVGIVGLGRIGRAVARRLEGFGVPIAYHARRANDAPYTYYASVVALAEAVDTLIVLVPGGPSTEKLIAEDVLAALGPNGVLINVARGSVIDDDALLDALEGGKILAAGLDVFRNEPRVPARFLERARTHNDLVLLPHLGSASIATRRAMDDLVVANVRAWSRGEPLLTPVVTR